MNRLIEQIIKGDKQAVVTFYKEHSPRIAHYLRKKLPREEDVEEILQDVFYEALDSLSLFSGKSTPSTWLFSIAHHKIVDFYRKKKIKSVLLSQLPFLQLFAHEITQPEFQLEKDRIRDKFEQTLHQLSEKYQTILTMHYELDMSIKEIALELDLSFKATESLLFRARQQFKLMYERE